MMTNLSKANVNVLQTLTQAIHGSFAKSEDPNIDPDML